MSAVQYRFAVSDAAGEPRELILRRADAGGLTVALTGATPALPVTMTEDDAADLGCYLIALARYGPTPGTPVAAVQAPRSADDGPRVHVTIPYGNEGHPDVTVNGRPVAEDHVTVDLLEDPGEER